MSTKADCREAKSVLSASLRHAELNVFAAPPRRLPGRIETLEDAFALAFVEDARSASCPPAHAGGGYVIHDRLRSTPLLPTTVVIGLGVGMAPRGNTAAREFALAVRTLASGQEAAIDPVAVGRVIQGAVDVEVEVRAVRRARPQVGPGGRVGNGRTSSTGTVGGILPGTRRAVTANHVAALVNQGTIGDPVVDGEGAQVGRLDWYLPLVPGEPNSLDVATVEFDAAADPPGSARPAGELEPGDEVTMHGGRSGATTGIVSAVEHDESIAYSGVRFPFVGLVEVTGTSRAFSRPGDSGSLVHRGNVVGGMLIAGVVVDRRSLLTEAGRLFATLDTTEMLV